MPEINSSLWSRYVGDDNAKLHGFDDSNSVGDARDRKSTSSCCFSLRSGLTPWFSRKLEPVTIQQLHSIQQRQNVWQQAL